MLVELKTPWFAPSPNVVKDKIQHISGRRYKVGVHEMDDSLKPQLPSDAVILDKAPKKEEKKEEQSTDLKDYDQLRSASDQVSKMAEDGEAEALKAKQARMAKARATKGARKGAATVE